MFLGCHNLKEVESVNLPSDRLIIRISVCFIVATLGTQLDKTRDVWCIGNHERNLIAASDFVLVVLNCVFRDCRISDGYRISVISVLHEFFRVRSEAWKVLDWATMNSVTPRYWRTAESGVRCTCGDSGLHIAPAPSRPSHTCLPATGRYLSS